MAVGARYASVAVVALALLAGTSSTACTTDRDDGDPGDGSRQSSPASRESLWRFEPGPGGTTIDAGTFVVGIDTSEGLRLGVNAVRDLPTPVQVLEDAGGLFIVRNGARQAIVSATTTEPGEDRVGFDVAFADGSTGTVELTAEGDHGMSVEVTPEDPTGVTAWGSGLRLAEGERIYGLTERIVDNWVDSEAIPKEVGSLDRRGETVTMFVTPTMSGYVPFHQSSAGYGLLVDGFMPGRYDVGASVPDELGFEFELEPATGAGSYHFLFGPDHERILQGYYDLAGHPRRPPDAVFRHWRGRDTNPVGVTADYDGQTMNAMVASDLDAYQRYDIPAGIYHFDRPWAVGQEGYGELRFDPARYPDAEGMLEVMDDLGWQHTVWMAPWAIDRRGAEASANGWLAPNSDRAIDLTNPDAVGWLQNDAARFLSSPEGRHIDGLFLDRGEEQDVSSEATDVYDDGRNGRQIHNWYPVEYAKVLADVMQDQRGDRGFLITRAGYTGSQQHTMRWGGDTRSREMVVLPAQDMVASGESPAADAPSTDLGLRSVLISMQRAAFMGTPYWGSDIGGYSPWTDRDLFARWIEVGFASPLMRFHGMGGTPWATTQTGEPDQELIDIYRRYIVMRQDPIMVGYLSAAAEEAATTGTPMVRPLVWEWSDEPAAGDRWDEFMLGADLLVAPVWRSGSRERTVWIPPGEWVDFWQPGSKVTGPAEITVEVPLDELPMWVRPGSPLLGVDVP